jgi:hypothetical protein
MKIKEQQTKERDMRIVCTSHERDSIKDHHKLNEFSESYFGHTPEPKNIFLTIRMTSEQMSYLNNICEQLSMSKSALVKGLIFSLMPE